jgi:hypothetical protein
MTTPTRTLRAIAAAIAVLAAAAPAAAAAGEPKNVGPFSAPPIHHPTAIDRVIAQEDARRGDPAIFGTAPPATTVIRLEQRPGGFDWGDAGIGGAATFALLLLAVGGTALWHERRQEAHG